MVKHIQPGQTIGIIGGGQLGRMMAMAARQMGYQIAVLDPTPNSPTGQVADVEITAAYDDFEAAKRLLDESDVITYEFESIDVSVCNYLVEQGYVPQGSELIRISQDRAFEKKAIEKSGARVVAYELIDDIEDLKRATSSVGFPCVLKTRRGGYDGKGQMILNASSDLFDATELLERGPSILEQFLSFEKELSVIVNRSVTGEMTTFPVAENIHMDHILLQSIVPARIVPLIAEKAKEVAKQLAESINMVGTLGVEMFLSEDGEIYINEVAPRPHNSGHYTLDACVTSQFEQHIRAITGMTLGEPKQHQAVVMMNVLGEHITDVLDRIPSLTNAKLHLYGKAQVKPKRKMGHVNFMGEQTKGILQQIKDLEIWRP
ncbi:5-(carboxyamino)imidazole ribonucleotide synthase [Tenuibacillus multivorans]|uniref:N5-carboxyaminoimidazole ribonucleotide synthase n=1 Tax=Tenuibacillus multivorans TaxID=237069 RepID=A0A1H0F892_9BACI|nr:5-(carboxyamino)imidazole ribonucleotide synthase [Tenuibacillus multivorans]GEL78034.1 N5-carboxyaminoimidazole ribonucleotide synthase [Tenuibacillus multivorans]SDN90846.1 5-(carboxyamino)imidazole ribonucleotide synthase [Tenuibacillus multivorans]